MYHLVFAVLYGVSLLPLRLLYVLSTLLYLILYYVLRYRIPVVRANLEASFPEKTPVWLRSVEKSYYRNLCDSVVETIKLISISRKEIERRITCNWEVFEILKTDTRNAQSFLAHQFNWEWGNVLANWHLPRRFTGIYLPLNSIVFDRIMLRIRQRSGMRLIRVQDMQKNLQEAQNEQILWGILADQNPSDPKRVSWNDFFHRKTAFFKGPEFIARRYNNLVYFGEIIRKQRGYYHIEMKLAFEHPRETTDGEITASWVHFLEESIKRQPANWVWSHRRWKHQYPDKEA